MPKKKAEKKGSILEGDLKRKGIVGTKDEFLEDEEHEGSHEAEELKIHTGEKDADVYTEEGREELEEDEEGISPWEEAFMKGAAGKGNQGTCANCEKILPQDEDEIIEREYRGETYFFCSDKCAKAGVKKE